MLNFFNIGESFWKWKFCVYARKLQLSKCRKLSDTWKLSYENRALDGIVYPSTGGALHHLGLCGVRRNASTSRTYSTYMGISPSFALWEVWDQRRLEAVRGSGHTGNEGPIAHCGSHQASLSLCLTSIRSSWLWPHNCQWTRPMNTFAVRASMDHFKTETGVSQEMSHNFRLCWCVPQMWWP